ncbi:MAG: corrinoid protein [Eubacterium sp.]|nr:corrinoid protein [Eubacterium sp.]
MKDQKSILVQIEEELVQGDRKAMLSHCEEAINEGIAVRAILDNALIPGMRRVSEKFHNAAGTVPEIMLSSRAMSEGIELLRPYILQERGKIHGRICIGTVAGDLHDIGKNLVAMVLESEGFEVIDLGVDVTPQEYVETAIARQCDIICCSALLTTTMPVMAEVVQEVRRAGVQDHIKVMIGGAPVSDEFAHAIDADGYSVDAVSAGETARKLLQTINRDGKTDRA